MKRSEIIDIFNDLYEKSHNGESYTSFVEELVQKLEKMKVLPPVPLATNFPPRWEKEEDDNN